jgi:DNA-binding transcriptional ArsR family regulator
MESMQLNPTQSTNGSHGHSILLIDDNAIQAATRQAILKHLQVLEAAGLMEHERDGREVRYRVTPKPLASAVAWIVDTAGQWDQRLDRLRKLTS